MEPEERKMLERLLHISEHNNRVLRHIRREMLLVRFIRIFYYLLILGVALVAYYYVKPYLEEAFVKIQTITSDVSM
jgi:hypothetical protein